MAEIVFVPDQKGIAYVTRSPSGPVGQHMVKMGRQLQRFAKRDVGVDTSKLRNSITSRVTVETSGLVTTVGSSNRIALMHHNGTRRHIIEPRTRRALKFTRGARIVFAGRVMHPGTKPNPYLTQNLARVVLTN